MKKKFSNPTPVKYIDLVWWQDAYTSNEKTGPKLTEGDNTLTLSIGVIVEEDKDFLHMSHFYDGIGNELSEPFTSIPIGMIKHRKKVKI